MKNNSFLSLLIAVSVGLSCSLFDDQANTSNSSNNGAAPQQTATPTKDPTISSAHTETNYLAFGSGSALLKFPVSSAGLFSPNNIFEGREAFWISREGEAKDQVFVLGLPGETVFKNFSFMNGNDYYGEGSNAKDILVEVSNTSADSGFQKVLETSLPTNIDPNTLYPAISEMPARYVKLTIKNSQSNPNFVSLGEFKGFGTQKMERSLTGLTGTYRGIVHDENTLGWKKLTPEELNGQGSYSDIYLRQNGTTMFGCEDQGEFDYFNGGIEGNVAQLVWQYVPAEPSVNVLTSFAENGTLLFVAKLNSDGYADSFDAFQKVSDVPGKCPNIKGFDSNAAGDSKLKEELEKTGRAVVYGINFDFNSDKLRPESKTLLDEITKLLKDNPDWKMAIEGHTDNIGGDSFNKELSDKRAASVKNYLTSAGIAADRLESAGFGLSKPIVPNDTEIGRARNRRVELVKR